MYSPSVMQVLNKSNQVLKNRALPSLRTVHHTPSPLAGRRAVPQGVEDSMNNLDPETLSVAQLLATMIRAALDNDGATFDGCQTALERQVQEADRQAGDFADDGYGANELQGVIR